MYKINCIEWKFVIQHVLERYFAAHASSAVSEKLPDGSISYVFPETKKLKARKELQSLVSGFLDSLPVQDSNFYFIIDSCLPSQNKMLPPLSPSSLADGVFASCSQPYELVEKDVHVNSEMLFSCLSLIFDHYFKLVFQAKKQLNKHIRFLRHSSYDSHFIWKILKEIYGPAAKQCCYVPQPQRKVEDVNFELGKKLPKERFKPSQENINDVKFMAEELLKGMAVNG